MDFSITEDPQAIRDGVSSVVRGFDDEYWLARDDDGVFPRDFHQAMANGGWLGITMPQEYGGAGLGVTEAVIMLHEVASHGSPWQPLRRSISICSAHIPFSSLARPSNASAGCQT